MSPGRRPASSVPSRVQRSTPRRRRSGGSQQAAGGPAAAQGAQVPPWGHPRQVIPEQLSRGGKETARAEEGQLPAGGEAAFTHSPGPCPKQQKLGTEVRVAAAGREEPIGAAGAGGRAGGQAARLPGGQEEKQPRSRRDRCCWQWQECLPRGRSRLTTAPPGS